jgi:hypothetical protein
VAVRVDEAGKQRFALHIDPFGSGGRGFGYFKQVANGYDLVAVNGDRGCVGILRLAGKNLGIEENAVSGFLRGCWSDSKTSDKNGDEDERATERNARRGAQTKILSMKKVGTEISQVPEVYIEISSTL